MESAKVVNKILLSYLTLGATFGIGILVKNSNIQKALMGTGAVAAVAIASTNKQEDKDKQDRDTSLEESQVTQLRQQEAELQKALDEASSKRQAIDDDINSLQDEQNQLISAISDLSMLHQHIVFVRFIFLDFMILK